MALVAFSCLSIFLLLTSQTETLVSLNILAHLRPEVGGGDFEVSLVSRIVAPENAVMGLTHGFLPVPGREVQCGSGIVKVAQLDPDELGFILK